MIFVEKKLLKKFWGLHQKLSIKSDEFTPPPPLARGTLMNPGYY
jgi:hypothetical protein